MNEKKKILIIVGPTASGKSTLALRLAKMLGGEIVSADSRAIYRIIRIGTDRAAGKWSGSKRKKIFKYQNVPHHLVDFLDPRIPWSAHDFAQATEKLLKNIETPLIVGGTGFWIDTLINPGLLAGPPPDQPLRKRLEKKTARQLFAQLKKLDASRAITIQKTNKRRLIRAIEVASSTVVLKGVADDKKPKYDILFIGLTHPNHILKERVRARLLLWLKRGLIAETKKLRKHVGEKRLKEIGLMYPIIAQHLDGKISKAQMIELSVNSIYHYAKRQKTWFRRNKDIHWVKNYDQAFRLAKNFLN